MKSGGENDSTIRTRMDQLFIVGVIGKDWNKSTVNISPFHAGELRAKQQSSNFKFRINHKKHLLETALKWKDERTSNPYVQTDEIATQADISPGRVRQILRLTKLHQDIQKRILELPPSQAKKRFPERILRELIPLKPEEQLNQFRQICSK